MTVTTLTSRKLSQDVARAKKAAESGPVLIADRGKPTHVLRGIEDYRRLTRRHRSLAGALSMPGLADIDFEPPRGRIDPRAKA